MKLLGSLFGRIYRYATIFIVVGSPLFFIPQAGFTPEVTYYVTMMIAIAVAIISYLVSSLLLRTWHSVSKLEFISYCVFLAAVILSVAFARDQNIALFGDALNPLSGVALISLPVVVYLVRTLPEALRKKLKYVMAIILGASVFALMAMLMLNGLKLLNFELIFVFRNILVEISQIEYLLSFFNDIWIHVRVSY